ncbi:TIGR01906 family membrane protein [Paenarthrobacter sp. PH39-S1]|uniref:TIGR01906 family membrane protein n=1 Tax=Paenarthrobacter sp. PH39-S1 TaxID=3046204 RepID=UPI0024B87C43|nr:TIGR01906 family membrane protein [Paenarthrobacter sp. PH39-S1]MDJ0356148.1 TIGR01906 family membrane protein [Paenarthrobacter sp. PH39-S1]
MSENKKPVSADPADDNVGSESRLPATPDESIGELSPETPEDDEPAFAWMTPAAAHSAAAQASTVRPGAGPSSGARTAAAPVPRHGPSADGPSADGPSADGSAVDAPSVDGSAVFHEPLPTSMLQIRPPQEDVDRRAAQREEAAKVQPVLPRVLQVVLAVCYPVVLLVLAIRLITTPLFLWVEYHRPGFPADTFGFSTDDRMTYGSYVVDYLLNFAGPRFLADLVKPDGGKLFAVGEVSHMEDVKSVITMAFIAGAVLAVVVIVAIVYLTRRSTGGVRRGLFAGSIVTLVLVIGLGVLAFAGWETFFTDFHQIFFKNGTWTFYLDDSLIRLFPEQFWTDSGLLIGVVVLLVSTLTLAFTWPTKQRRNLSKRARNPRQGRRAAAGI